MMRLDKYLADMNIGTRTEIKKHLRRGAATVNGEVVKKPEYKVSQTDVVTFLGREITYQKTYYYMLHKPAGIVSATKDNIDTTVIDLLDDIDTTDLFPVGRLDKDTEGLLILTNDGKMAHDLLSPKKHVDKKYYAKIEGVVKQSHQIAFQEGLDIGEKNKTLPADLEILSSDNVSEVYVTIREGKFHQIKRMFHAINMDVLYLKRMEMGPIKLDETLEPGEYRTLTKEEIEKLC